MNFNEIINQQYINYKILNKLEHHYLEHVAMLMRLLCKEKDVGVVINNDLSKSGVLKTPLNFYNASFECYFLKNFN